MRKFIRQAYRIADTLSLGESIHILGGTKEDMEEFLAELLGETVTTDKQIEALTKERQMDIMLSPDKDRRPRVVKLLEAVENVELDDWPLVRPLWMVVALLEGCSLCQAIFYIRSGYVRVSGERQWSADSLRNQHKSVQKSFIPDPEHLEKVEDGDEALKFGFDNAITNPDSLMLCRRIAPAHGVANIQFWPGDFTTLDKVVLSWAGDHDVDDEDLDSITHERPPGIAPAKPSKSNLAGHLEVAQVHPDSKLLSWLADKSRTDATVCWPMVYFDLRPFFDPDAENHPCKEASS